MSRRLLFAGIALLIGVLFGRYWPTVPPAAAVATATPTPPAKAASSAARRPASTVATPRAITPSNQVAGPSPAALGADHATLWTQSKRLIRCSSWNRGIRTFGGVKFDPENEGMDTEIESIEMLIEGAVAQWKAETSNDKRAALWQRWSAQVTALCAPYGEADEETMYRSARDAALLGSREARTAFLANPPLVRSFSQRPELWNDWADTAAQLLDDMVAQGDAEALYIRGVALGFDNSSDEELLDSLYMLMTATPNDPPRAYRDLRGYLASGDQRHAAAARTLLQQVGERVDAAQRAAIDAEFAAH